MDAQGDACIELLLVSWTPCSFCIRVHLSQSRKVRRLSLAMQDSESKCQRQYPGCLYCKRKNQKHILDIYTAENFATGVLNSLYLFMCSNMMTHWIKKHERTQNVKFQPINQIYFHMWPLSSVVEDKNAVFFKPLSKQNCSQAKKCCA